MTSPRIKRKIQIDNGCFDFTEMQSRSHWLRSKKAGCLPADLDERLLIPKGFLPSRGIYLRSAGSAQGRNCQNACEILGIRRKRTRAAYNMWDRRRRVYWGSEWVNRLCLESGFHQRTDDLVHYFGEREKERERECDAAGGAVTAMVIGGREWERKERERRRMIQRNISNQLIWISRSLWTDFCCLFFKLDALYIRSHQCLIKEHISIGWSNSLLNANILYCHIKYLILSYRWTFRTIRIFH